MKDIERLADKIKNPVPRPENYTAEYQDTTRSRAASDLTSNRNPCLMGLDMNYMEQLLGKGQLIESKDRRDWPYTLMYSLCEFDEKGEAILSNGLPSTLYIHFNKSKLVVDFYIIAY